MRLRGIYIDSFGGVANLRLQLEEGLNVVVGPNEAGKTTLFEAIQQVLFCQSNLTSGQFRKQLGKFVPVTGGDTICVSLEFSSNGDRYTLERSWGGTHRSELVLPDGSRVTDDKAIAERIQELLIVPEGTCRSVMLAPQSRILDAVKDVAEKPEIQQALGDVLRGAVMQLDGVSVDGFLSELEERLKATCARWDFASSYPESNRGIENPFARGIGAIVKKFYEKEQTRLDRERAVAYEERLDELNIQLASSKEKLTELDSFLSSRKSAGDDAQKRRGLEGARTTADLQGQQLTKATEEWIRLESEQSRLATGLPDLEKKAKSAADKEATAKKREATRALREQLGRVREREATLNKAKEALAGVKGIEDSNIDSARQIKERLAEISGELSSKRLGLSFKALSPISLTSEANGNPSEKHELADGESLQVSGEGAIKLSHEQWQLEVKSGVSDNQKLIEERSRLTAKLNADLSALGVESIDEAIETKRDYVSKKSAVEAAKGELTRELSGTTIEDLKKQVPADEDAQQTNIDLATIVEAKVTAEQNAKQARDSLEDAKGKIRTYVDEHESRSKLVLKLANASAAVDKLDEQLANLTPLPEEFETADDLLQAIAAKDAERERLREELNQVRVELAGAEADAPESSSEELKALLKTREQELGDEIRKGEALRRLLATTKEMLETADSCTFDGLKKSIELAVAKMTSGRYKTVSMSEGKPEGFARADGKNLPYDLLSTGTKDALALALRVAIAEQHLAGREGFMVMDDPLVDLDDDRQEAAAEYLREKAAKMQIVVLTCHQRHADLLAGTVHRLDGPQKSKSEG